VLKKLLNFGQNSIKSFSLVPDHLMSPLKGPLDRPLVAQKIETKMEEVKEIFILSAL